MSQAKPPHLHANLAVVFVHRIRHFSVGSGTKAKRSKRCQQKRTRQEQMLDTEASGNAFTKPLQGNVGMD